MPRKAFTASPAQRQKAGNGSCIACGGCWSGCDAAHLIDRSITTVGQDDPLAVVALCRACHRDYDDGILDLLPALEPRHRSELAYAVERVGLITTLRRVTNDRYIAARAA